MYPSEIRRRKCNKALKAGNPKSKSRIVFLQAGATPVIFTLSGKVTTSSKTKGLPPSQRQVLSHHTSVDLK